MGWGAKVASRYSAQRWLLPADHRFCARCVSEESTAEGFTIQASA